MTNPSEEILSFLSTNERVISIRASTRLSYENCMSVFNQTYGHSDQPTKEMLCRSINTLFRLMRYGERLELQLHNSECKFRLVKVKVISEQEEEVENVDVNGLRHLTPSSPQPRYGPPNALSLLTSAFQPSYIRFPAFLVPFLPCCHRAAFLVLATSQPEPHRPCCFHQPHYVATVPPLQQPSLLCSCTARAPPPPLLTHPSHAYLTFDLACAQPLPILLPTPLPPLLAHPSHTCLAFDLASAQPLPILLPTPSLLTSLVPFLLPLAARLCCCCPTFPLAPTIPPPTWLAPPGLHSLCPRHNHHRLWKLEKTKTRYETLERATNYFLQSRKLGQGGVAQCTREPFRMAKR